ncbi:MAG: ATP-binding cassette domain-containing protein [Lachnospiraceae bacterium]
MGIYSESIRERYETDNKNAQFSEESLFQVLTTFRTLNSDTDDVQAALNIILRKFNVKIQLTDKKKSIEDLFSLYLEPMGIMYEFVALEKGWQKSSFDYMVGFTSEGEAVALLPVVGGYQAVFRDGNRKVLIFGGAAAFQSVAICIHRPFGKKQFSVFGFAEYIFTLFSPRDVIPIATAMGAIALLGLLTPSMYHYVLNTLVPTGSASLYNLALLACLFVGAGVTSAIINTVRNNLLSKLNLRITAQAQTAIVTKLLLLPDRFFNTNSTGKVSAYITDGKRLANIMVGVFINSSLTAVFSLIYIPQMFYLAQNLAIPALILLLVQIMISLLIGLASVDRERKSIVGNMDLNGFTYSSIRGIQKIKNTGAEKRIFAKWAQLYRVRLKEIHNPSPLVMLGDTLLTTLSSMGVIIFMIIATDTGIFSASYIAFYAAFTMISSGFSSFMDVINQIMLIKPLSNQLRPIFETAPEQNEVKKQALSLKGQIDLENILFRYDASQSPVISNVNLSIMEGECVAIVGESGCGKSTLLRMLLGFETPDSGNIYYDKTPINAWDIRSLRKNLGVVLQSSQLMPGTIYSNIAFNSSWLTEDAVWLAAEKAQIADFIREQPLGMDTALSEASGGLSGGQKQCILLARALATNPSILLLDEATSAMDNITQAKVLQSLTDLKMTRVMVAHRLSTVVNCDRIFLLSKGEIVEAGTYKELLEMNGRFAELVRRQMI